MTRRILPDGGHHFRGIGKTTYCSWLCHQPDVLGNFETVVWVTLGQEADLQRVLQLVYLQLEPQGLLPPALSMDLAKVFCPSAWLAYM